MVLVATSLMLMGLGAVAGTASAAAYCEGEEANGRWSYHCTGVDSQACVGTWGASGTYEDTPTGGRIYKTESSYRQSVCGSMAGVSPPPTGAPALPCGTTSAAMPTELIPAVCSSE